MTTACEFRAVTTCPACGHIATHWIEQPPPPIHERGLSEDQQRLVEMIYYLASVRNDNSITKWTTETCSIIRECRTCNHKWGET